VAYVNFVADRKSAFQLLFGSGARRDEEFAEAVRNVEASLAAFVADRIEAAIDDDQRITLAYAIVGMAEGAVRHALAAGGGLPDPDRMARQLSELSWAGLRGVRRI
jgi:hypothetical protein